MKAQISGQVFIYIIAAIVAGLILLVGTKVIMYIIEVTNVVNIDEFKADVQNTVAQISTEYGSVKKKDFRLSSKLNEACFVDSMNEQNEFNSDTKTANYNGYAIIENSVSNDVKKNVFLLQDKIVKQDFYVDNLEVENHFLCVDNTGLFTVWLKGQGNRALLYLQ
jgi:hypothetical protein